MRPSQERNDKSADIVIPDNTEEMLHEDYFKPLC